MKWNSRSLPPLLLLQFKRISVGFGRFDSCYWSCWFLRNSISYLSGSRLNFHRNRSDFCFEKLVFNPLHFKSRNRQKGKHAHDPSSLHPKLKEEHWTHHPHMEWFLTFTTDWKKENQQLSSWGYNFSNLATVLLQIDCAVFLEAWTFAKQFNSLAWQGSKYW